MTDTNPTDNPKPDDQPHSLTNDTDDPELTFNDPDDYHRARRLKQIHRARERVQDARLEYSEAWNEKEHQVAKRVLATTVTSYVDELLPLLRHSDTDDPLDNPDVKTERLWHDLEQFATMGGRYPPGSNPPGDREGGDLAAAPHLMTVFRLTNHALSDLRPLIEEEETTEWEV
jgi:hypothetical protein